MLKIISRRLSEDWRTSVMAWACPKCGYDKNRPIDSMIRYVQIECGKCGHMETVDQNEL